MLSQGAFTAWGSPVGALLPSSAYGFDGRTGAYRDDETGLILMGARYYAPAIGRFISRDPSGFSAGPNVYAYCGDDPVGLYDPTGRDWQWIEDRWRQSVEFGFWFQDQTSLKRVAQEMFDGLVSSAAAAGNASGSPKASAAETWGRETLLCAQVGLTAFGVAGPVAGIADAGAAAAQVGASASVDMAAVRAAGDAGEEAAGILKNTETIKSLTKTADYRVPDELDHDLQVVGEVKNVARLSLTRQIRDYVAYAQANG